jgi:hypothetical protein
LGGQPANEINIFYSQFFTIFYFSYFLILLPLTGYIENSLYEAISENSETNLNKNSDEFYKK